MLHDHTFDPPLWRDRYDALGQVEGGDEFGDRADGVSGELCRVCFWVDAASLADVALGGVLGWVVESRLDLAEDVARGLDVVCELAAGELGSCLPRAARPVVEEDVDEVVVVLLCAAVASGVRLREQVALQPREAGLVGRGLGVDDSLDRFFGSVTRDVACAA
ncbi:MAG: hypothetical protein ACRDLM_03855 [Gaiellaceae bacterium]